MKLSSRYAGVAGTQPQKRDFHQQKGVHHFLNRKFTRCRHTAIDQAGNIVYDNRDSLVCLQQVLIAAVLQNVVGGNV